MSRIKYLTMTFFVILTLAACSEVGYEVGDNTLTRTSTINSFTVTGTSTVTNSPIPINANINSGAFTVTWNVTSTDLYRVKIYVSEDALLDSSNDVHILNESCSFDSIDTCDENGSFACAYTTGNQISCDGGIQNSLSGIITSLPQTAYLIIEACNLTSTSCPTQSAQVEFL